MDVHSAVLVHHYLATTQPKKQVHDAFWFSTEQALIILYLIKKKVQDALWFSTKQALIILYLLSLG